MGPAIGINAGYAFSTHGGQYDGQTVVAIPENPFPWRAGASRCAKCVPFGSDLAGESSLNGHRAIIGSLGMKKRCCRTIVD